MEAGRCNSYGPFFDLEIHGRRGFRVAAIVRVAERLSWPCPRAWLRILGNFLGIKGMRMGKRGRTKRLLDGQAEEHNSPKSVPLPIPHQPMGTNNRTAQCQLDAAACSDWAWLSK